ncbi:MULTISPECIES: VOC family protein [unclassified Sphingomonas]|uniref:VOC family protein n=1 Tax=unclassified Sphingomonas TaxID=196159 RepID=UPI00226AE3C9|nr:MULTISPECIES: VOC family protein [unclassified Sphingomonas]
MKFAYTRLVTDDLQRLVAFYEQVLRTPPEGNAVFQAFRLDGADLGLFSRAAADQVHGGEWNPGTNRSAIIEFLVDDVDAEYDRLSSGAVTDWLHGPKDMPWGNRSMLFRDPDGNTVNIFRPIAPTA